MPKTYSDRLKAAIHIKKAQLFSCRICGATLFQKTSCPKCGYAGIESLSNESYKATLLQLTGKDSCSKCNEMELKKILSYFFKASFQTAVQKSNKETKHKMIQAIEGKAWEMMGARWGDRLSAYTFKRFKTYSLKDLNLSQLRAVQGFLSALQKSNK